MGDAVFAANKVSPDKHVVYLTGFGPFGPHIMNASEAAVTLVSRSSLASELGVELVHDILDVDYAKTKNTVPQQWEQYKPQLVVHVGVSGQADRLTLEQCAYNTGYNTLDISNNRPSQHCCIPGGNEKLKSALPLESICDALNNHPNLRLKSCLSQDPGRYLCSFVYYTSLHRDRSRVVFVHVPPLDVCPAEDTAQCLKEAIALLYRAVADTSATAGAAVGVSDTTPASSSAESYVKASGNERGCEKSSVGSCCQKSCMVGCDGKSSRVGCGGCDGKSSMDGCCSSSSLRASGRGERETRGEKEQVSCVEGRRGKEARKSVNGLENGNESLCHLNNAMLKISTDD